jgi:hypothetical protein
MILVWSRWKDASTLKVEVLANCENAASFTVVLSGLSKTASSEVPLIPSPVDLILWEPNNNNKTKNKNKAPNQTNKQTNKQTK